MMKAHTDSHITRLIKTQTSPVFSQKPSYDFNPYWEVEYFFQYTNTSEVHMR